MSTVSSPPRTARRLSLLFCLAAAAILVHGYHPYVVDASIYLTGIQKSIDPALFAPDSPFVAQHAGLSVFSYAVATLQHVTRLPLDALMLLTYVALVFGLLLVSHALGKRIFQSEAAGWGASLLMTACMPIPVAATSLLFVDPYLTARSFSTPLGLLLALSCIRGQYRLACGCLLLTALFHPLMGVYLAAFLLIYFLVVSRRWRWIAAFCALAFILSGAVTLITRHSTISASYREAVLSRSYYFPTVWHWYEIAGLLAPLLLLALAAGRAAPFTDLGRLASTCLIVGATSCLCCFCFVHPPGPYFLARVQLLRSFHIIYGLGIVMLGGSIATYTRRPFRVAAVASLAVLVAGMFLMQRHVYNLLPDVELPGLSTGNSWEDALLWIRRNTPPTAYFAIDPQLTANEDESRPGFRAMTRRSVLIDVKDEGLASLFPALAPVWASNRLAGQGLARLDDQEQRRQLESVGIDWVLLPRLEATTLGCPFHNRDIKVCQLK